MKAMKIPTLDYMAEFEEPALKRVKDGQTVDAVVAMRLAHTGLAVRRRQIRVEGH